PGRERGATHRLPQERLGLVVTCMRHDDAVGALLTGNAVQERVANASRRVLDVPTSFLGNGANVYRRGREPHPQGGAEVLHELGVGRRGWTQAVVDVPYDHVGVRLE